MSGFLLIGILVAIFILCYWLADAELKSGLRYGFLRFKGDPDNLRVRADKIGVKSSFIKDLDAPAAVDQEDDPKSKYHQKKYLKK